MGCNAMRSLAQTGLRTRRPKPIQDGRDILRWKSGLPLPKIDVLRHPIKVHTREVLKKTDAITCDSKLLARVVGTIRDHRAATSDASGHCRSRWTELDFARSERKAGICEEG